MPIPRPSVEGILGEFRQQDYVTVDGRLRTFVRTDRTLIRKTISLLQDRTDDEAVKLRRHEHAQPLPMDERQTPYMSLGARGTFHGLRRYTFARNDLLFTMSDNTRMQATRGRDALHARISFHGRATREPLLPLVEPDGIEPTTSCLQSRRSPN
jgi:hypothetical protein